MKKNIHPLIKFLDDAGMPIKEFAGHAGISYGVVFRCFTKKINPQRHNAMKMVKASQRIAKDYKHRKHVDLEPLKPSYFGIYDYD